MDFKICSSMGVGHYIFKSFLNFIQDSFFIAFRVSFWAGNRHLGEILVLSFKIGIKFKEKQKLEKRKDKKKMWA